MRARWKCHVAAVVRATRWRESADGKVIWAELDCRGFRRIVRQNQGRPIKQEKDEIAGFCYRGCTNRSDRSFARKLPARSCATRFPKGTVQRENRDGGLSLPPTCSWRQRLYSE